MELKDQVCSLEQAKRLKELGVKQDSLWHWIYPARTEIISTTYGVYYHEQAKEIIAGNDGDQFDSENSPAFTATELGEMLPSDSGIICWDVSYNDHQGQYECRIYDLVKWIESGQNRITAIPPRAYESECDTMAEAMADALIHCLENKLVTP